MRQFIVVFLFIVTFTNAYSQKLYSKFGNNNYSLYDSYVYRSSRPIHTSIKPYQNWQLDSIVGLDSLYAIKTNSRLIDWALNKNFVEYENSEFWFSANPYMNLELAKEGEDQFYKNTRGIEIHASIGTKFSVFTGFYENQATYPLYMKNWIEGHDVAPGQGRTKKFKEDGYDFAAAEGYLSYSPSKYFNIMFGHGKNFLGDGYNSLLLSDRAFNYPHLKLTTEIWKLKYVNIYAQMMDLIVDKELAESGGGFKRKNASIHYLSWNAAKWLNVSVFEAIVWQMEDSTYNRGFDINYVNPVILFRPVEYSVGSPDNALLGANMKCNLPLNTFIYGQLILDEFDLSHVLEQDGWWGNKSGFQLGAKTYQKLQKHNIFLQAEYNTVRPYTYSHRSSLRAYGHYNEPLAHPLGANFKETVVRVAYDYGRVGLDFTLINSQKGLDSTSASYGGDIFKPYMRRVAETGNETLQGLENTVFSYDVCVSYLINYNYALNIAAGMHARSELLGTETTDNTFIYLALRTSLRNIYNY